jgi:dipeptidyl aminopeptidase/acylaminoacyl peptidase
VIEMTSAPSDRRRWFSKSVGIVLIVLGGLWSLLWAGVWYAIWALTGAGGVLLLALDWRFFGPTALGVAVLAVGIWLAFDERTAGDQPTLPAQPPAAAPATPSAVGPRAAGDRSKLSIVVGSIVLALLALFGLEWALSIQDEGPYPFTEVPRGGLIAYSGPEGVRLVRSEGGRSWLVSGAAGMSGPVWAPDGTRLAAAKSDGGSSTYSFAADGSARDRLPFDVETTPVWSPDGRRMLVVGADVRIRVVRLADGVVEATLPLEGNEPAWSPDGKLIAFQSNRGDDVLQIYLVRPDGTHLRRLTSDRNNRAGNLTGAYSAAWSPDGRRLAFASDRDGDADIYIVRPGGTGLRKVTRNLVEDSSPSWSPDGRRIVFDRTDYERERTAIVVVDLANGAETELVHSDDFVYEPAWQPAGIG